MEEIEEMKSLMSKQSEDADVMKAEILLLKGQAKKEMDRNTRLEHYTRRENIRLLNVKGKSRQDKRGGKLQGGIFCP